MTTDDGMDVGRIVEMTGRKDGTLVTLTDGFKVGFEGFEVETGDGAVLIRN